MPSAATAAKNMRIRRNPRSVRGVLAALGCTGASVDMASLLFESDRQIPQEASRHGGRLRASLFADRHGSGADGRGLTRHLLLSGLVIGDQAFCDFVGHVGAGA